MMKQNYFWSSKTLASFRICSICEKKKQTALQTSDALEPSELAMCTENLVVSVQLLNWKKWIILFSGLTCYGRK